MLHSVITVSYQVLVMFLASLDDAPAELYLYHTVGVICIQTFLVEVRGTFECTDTHRDHREFTINSKQMEKIDSIHTQHHQDVENISLMLYVKK